MYISADKITANTQHSRNNRKWNNLNLSFSTTITTSLLYVDFCYSVVPCTSSANRNCLPVCLSHAFQCGQVHFSLRHTIKVTELCDQTEISFAKANRQTRNAIVDLPCMKICILGSGAIVKREDGRKQKIAFRRNEIENTEQQTCRRRGKGGASTKDELEV